MKDDNQKALDAFSEWVERIEKLYDETLDDRTWVTIRKALEQPEYEQLQKACTIVTKERDALIGDRARYRDALQWYGEIAASLAGKFDGDIKDESFVFAILTQLSIDGGARAGREIDAYRQQALNPTEVKND